MFGLLSSAIADDVYVFVSSNFWHQGPRYLFLEIIQGAFWEQNGKNDGFTKMSVEL